MGLLFDTTLDDLSTKMDMGLITLDTNSAITNMHLDNIASEIERGTLSITERIAYQNHLLANPPAPRPAPIQYTPSSYSSSESNGILGTLVCIAIVGFAIVGAIMFGR